MTCEKLEEKIDALNKKSGKKKTGWMLELEKMEEELQMRSADKDYTMLDLHKFKVVFNKGKTQYTGKQYSFANSYNRMLAEGDQLIKANLQTFICVAKDTLNNLPVDEKLAQESFAKIEKVVFEKIHDKPMLFKKPYSIHPECDFSFSSLKELKHIHESKGYSTLTLSFSIKLIHKEFSDLDNFQKSSLNSSVLRLISRETSVKEYLETVANSDCLLPALVYLYLLMTRMPHLCEVNSTEVKPICLILGNAWTLHSSQASGDSLDNDWMPFFIMKCSDLLYSLEPSRERSVLVGSRRRSLLLDFDWKKKYVSEYTSYPEFWLKMISLSIQQYTQDPGLLLWSKRNPDIHGSDQYTETDRKSSTDVSMNESTALIGDEGIFDVATLALAGVGSQENEQGTPNSVSKRAANECALQDTVRWKIYSGDDIDQINKFCKKASLKFHLKSTLIHSVLLSLEDCFLWHDKVKPINTKVVVDKHTCLAAVFEYLTAADGLNLTLISRQFRVSYRLAHLRSVLINCVLSQPIRLSIWMQFVGGVKKVLLENNVKDS